MEELTWPYCDIHIHGSSLQLDLVADNASLADALADEEPAGHLGHDDGVDGCLLHGGL